jgi:hypothetical protein
LHAARRRPQADAASRLAERATGAGLTIDEHVERVRALEWAATPEEIDAALGHLPDADTGAPTRSVSWLVGILGGTEQRGRWRLSRRLRIVAVLGGVTLDVGHAQPEARDPVITVVAVVGAAEIIAPPGVPIAFSGFSLLGGVTVTDASAPPAGRFRRRRASRAADVE